MVSVIWDKNEEMFNFYKQLNFKKHEQMDIKQDINIKDGLVILNEKAFKL